MSIVKKIAPMQYSVQGTFVDLIEEIEEILEKGPNGMISEIIKDPEYAARLKVIAETLTLVAERQDDDRLTRMAMCFNLAIGMTFGLSMRRYEGTDKEEIILEAKKLYKSKAVRLNRN